MSPAGGKAPAASGGDSDADGASGGRTAGGRPRRGLQRLHKADMAKLADMVARTLRDDLAEMVDRLVDGRDRSTADAVASVTSALVKTVASTNGGRQSMAHRASVARRPTTAFHRPGNMGAGANALTGSAVAAAERRADSGRRSPPKQAQQDAGAARGTTRSANGDAFARPTLGAAAAQRGGMNPITRARGTLAGGGGKGSMHTMKWEVKKMRRASSRNMLRKIALNEE